MSQWQPIKSLKKIMHDKRLHQIRMALIGGVVATLMLLVTLTVYTTVRYYNRVLPGIHVQNTNLSGLDRDQVAQIIESLSQQYQSNWPITLTYQEHSWDLQPTSQQLGIDIEKSVDVLMGLGRTQNVVNNFIARITWMRHDVNIPLEVRVDEPWLNSLAQEISSTLDEPVIPPTIEYDESKSGNDRLKIIPEQPGKSFQKDQFSDGLLTAVKYLEKPTQNIPVKQVNLKITSQEIDETLQSATQLLDKKLIINHTTELGKDYSWTLNDKDLISFLGFNSSINAEKISDYILEAAVGINQPAQNAKFIFNSNTGSVEEFAPALSGIEIDIKSTTNSLEQAISELIRGNEPQAIALSIIATEPEITLNDVNELGINELLGRGESTYFGSIPSRVHNVAVAAGRVTGTLVKPGEEFSFNASVGDISQATGFQPAYIISNGRTELGDGGGVCQDSTTIFRAALDAGLPITERRSHSYRVGYYEQNAKAGLDATVYSPTTDLKFLNDTPAHILIQVYADSINRTMVVEIYGTSDGRVGQVSNHVVYDITPPLPDQFIDDPSLPNGTVKQIDWKAGGAKAKFDYTVTRDGKTIFEETYYSNYKPWAAKFLRGTG